MVWDFVRSKRWLETSRTQAHVYVIIVPLWNVKRVIVVKLLMGSEIQADLNFKS